MKPYIKRALIIIIYHSYKKTLLLKWKQNIYIVRMCIFSNRKLVHIDEKIAKN